MSEQLRKVEITVTVDTNKRTMTVDLFADTLDEALDQVREHLSDVRWTLQ